MVSAWVTMSSERPVVELQVDVAERLQPGAEPGLGPAHALGDRADPAVAPGQQRDDPVGLAELLHPEHDRLVPVQGQETHSLSAHGAILALQVVSTADAHPAGRSAHVDRRRT